MTNKFVKRISSWHWWSRIWQYRSFRYILSLIKNVWKELVCLTNWKHKVVHLFCHSRGFGFGPRKVLGAARSVNIIVYILASLHLTASGIPTGLLVFWQYKNMYGFVSILHCVLRSTSQNRIRGCVLGRIRKHMSISSQSFQIKIWWKKKIEICSIIICTARTVKASVSRNITLQH